MVSLNPPVCNFGEHAHDFDLLGVDGKRYSLANAAGKNGLLVMFICNIDLQDLVNYSNI